MDIQTELTRITNAKAAIKAAIEGKGVTVPDGTLLDGMASLIESIEVGGGGGAGFSVTFPATANNWAQILNYATLVLSDGSTVDFKDYSVVAGRTINNVIDIRVDGKYNYILRLTLTAGAIVLVRVVSGGMSLNVNRFKAPATTPVTYMTHSSDYSFMPVEDIIISAIEMIDSGD